MSGGGLGSTGVTQSGGGSSFGMNQSSQGMGQSSPQPMMSQQPTQQPMQQGPFGGQFGNMFGGQQFGFQQPQPFYQQQFNPYAMASQAQRLGISQVPIRNQYGPYGGQMYQQPYQQPMQQPMQQPQTNYPQPMGYPQGQDMATNPLTDFLDFYKNENQGQFRQQPAIQQPINDLSNFDLTGQGVFRRGPMLRNVLPQQQLQDPITTRTLGDEQYQNKLNFARQQLNRRSIPYNFGPPQFNPNQVMHHGRVSTPMPRHMLPQEMQGPDVSDTFVDIGRVDMTSPAETPMTAQDILKMAVGKSTPDLRYDSNGDGKITSADALAFQRSMQQKGMV